MRVYKSGAKQQIREAVEPLFDATLHSLVGNAVKVLSRVDGYADSDPGPGRTSSSQTGFVEPFIPHHSDTYSGSVQSLNTTSRGASKIRVMTSDRVSGEAVAVEAVSVVSVTCWASRWIEQS